MAKYRGSDSAFTLICEAYTILGSFTAATAVVRLVVQGCVQLVDSRLRDCVTAMYAALGIGDGKDSNITDASFKRLLQASRLAALRAKAASEIRCCAGGVLVRYCD